MLQYIYDQKVCLFQSFKSKIEKLNLRKLKTLYFFKGDYEEQKFLKAEVSVAKLMKILRENTFQSGSVIDYYDYE